MATKTQIRRNKRKQEELARLAEMERDECESIRNLLARECPLVSCVVTASFGSDASQLHFEVGICDEPAFKSEITTTMNTYIGSMFKAGAVTWQFIQLSSSCGAP